MGTGEGAVEFGGGDEGLGVVESEKKEFWSKSVGQDIYSLHLLGSKPARSLFSLKGLGTFTLPVSPLP